jgi:hypothetical protein
MIEFARKGIPILLLVVILTLTSVEPTKTQTSEVSALSYQAFNQLAQVYRSGGTSPKLVALLNNGLVLVEEARAKRAQSDAVSAAVLESQARAIFVQMSPQISFAQQDAIRNATSRVQILFVETALTVCTLMAGLYGGILLYRWYEKERLFEMKILGKDTET